MNVRVLFHDNCFDGATSAALFTAFYRACVDKDAIFRYRGMTHGAGDVFAGAFDEDAASGAVQHVCVDFRYSPDPRLDWWFDHHQSAFMTPADAAKFHAAHNPQHFYDPAAQSCSKFLALRCAAAFGFDPEPFAELIEWADLIDGAKFASPAQAVECREPALQLMQWVEANRDPALKLRFIADLLRSPETGLAGIAAQAYVQDGLRPLHEEAERVLTLLRARAECEDGVVTYDVSDQNLASVSKFAPYYLFPDSHYVVGVLRMPGRIKLTIGSNPWRSERRTANIADICGRYGGGGHPAVGAVSLPDADLERARTIARDVATELRGAAQAER